MSSWEIFIVRDIHDENIPKHTYAEVYNDAPTKLRTELMPGSSQRLVISSWGSEALLFKACCKDGVTDHKGSKEGGLNCFNKCGRELPDSEPYVSGSDGFELLFEQIKYDKTLRNQETRVPYLLAEFKIAQENKATAYGAG
ncbi:hypothetical protein HHI36_010593 [Cryptolaemus montrouzieri]|uniref:Uncharacterized protein n=1 Tax=Cryptolaemus montrouzieri TaxID=559131 RepID=A0ABD2MJB5_9CUCU